MSELAWSFVFFQIPHIAPSEVLVLTMVGLMFAVFTLSRRRQSHHWKTERYHKRHKCPPDSERAYGELVAANQKLIRNNDKLRQFLYTVSHNIKGPIANFKGLLELIEREKMSADNAELLKKIEETTIVLEGSIKDLTRTIDVQHSANEIYQRISLHEEIEKIKTLLSLQITESKATVKADISGLEYIYSEPALLRSILLNLISNAIKYRSPHQPLKVNIGACLVEGCAHLVVEDNGLGMNLEKYGDKLFGMYNRFSGKAIEGKGMGLFLTKMQVDLLGGKIDVESAPEKGSRFTVSLPIPKRPELQPVWENNIGALYFDARLHCLKTHWKKDMPDRFSLRETVEKVAEAAVLYHTPIWAFDLAHGMPPHKWPVGWETESGCSDRLKNSPLRRIVLLTEGDEKGAFDLSLLKAQLKKGFGLPVRCLALQNGDVQNIKCTKNL